MSAHELTEVSKTAIGVALVRAMESRRTDRLFNDPYAGELVLAERGWRSHSYDRRAIAESYGRDDPGRNPGEFVIATLVS